MKKYLLILLSSISLASCSYTNQKDIQNEVTLHNKEEAVMDKSVLKETITYVNNRKMLDIYDKNYDAIINGSYSYVEWKNTIETGSYINVRSNYDFSYNEETGTYTLNKISPADNIPNKISININTWEFKILEKSRLERDMELSEKTSDIEDRIYKIELKTYKNEIATALKIARDKFVNTNYSLEWMVFDSYGSRDDYWEYVYFKKDWMYWLMAVNLTKKEVDFIH